MSSQFSFRRRLSLVLIPTPAQVLYCILASAVIIIGARAQEALALIGIDNAALDVSRIAFHGRFETLLNSPISQTAALITFWSGVGIIIYLICWLGLSLFSQARNELTLTTEYANRGHWRGPYETLALKAIGAAALVTCVALLKPGLAFWLAIVVDYIAAPSTGKGLFALAAMLGFAVQLYLILAFALVTFTPWYRPEAFTEREK